MEEVCEDLDIGQGSQFSSSSILILTIIFHRTLRTIPNLLTANSSLAIFIYALATIAQIIVGLQPRDKGKEDLCALQYSSEMHMCCLKMSFQGILFVYMGTALGIPFFGIVTIYLYITNRTRRIHIMTIAITTSLSTANRDLRVLKKILTLIGILGTAGLPNIVLLIWNAFSSDGAPVSLYLICALTISFCTNIQISFIFSMNKNVRVIFWNYVQRILY
ncbi:unnamed protein product [Rotaria sp. Silwood1]|nr:unnamed protein product [Rotaria sp. Silwood1]